ncbi:MAG: hypothetical protein PUD15_08620 [Prevotella sp.]|nr:hypothetical protein [Prevotella sp.]
MPNDKIVSKEEESIKRASEIEKQNVRLFYGGSEGITADHPSVEYRMSQFQKFMPEAMQIYEQKLQERKEKREDYERTLNFLNSATLLQI